MKNEEEEEDYRYKYVQVLCISCMTVSVLEVVLRVLFVVESFRSSGGRLLRRR